MNILILGSGIVGANLAKKLSEQGKNVFLLDDDANELKNLSENVTSLLTDSNLFVSKVLIEDLMKNSTNNADLYDLNFKEAKDKFEKDYLLQKLKINNFNMTLTAKMLRLDRVSLYRKVKSLNIKID